jgi:hypothetical protein
VARVVPITIHEGGYSICDRYPFRDGAALALNPADGELYGLVNSSASQSAGGGVYRLTGGPGRGVRMHAYTGPEGLVLTVDGNGFVSEDGSGDLFRFVGADTSQLWVDGGSGFHSGDDDIAGMAVAPSGFMGANVSPGDLLVTDWGNGGPDEIWSVNPDTANGERLLVPDPGSADFWDVVATPAGEVYVADSVQDDQLWRLMPDGTLVPFLLASSITNMQALAHDPGGNAIYTLKTTAPLGLYRIDLADGAVVLIADGFQAFQHGNIEIDSAARKLYVSDEDDNQIYTICLPSVVAVEESPRRPAGLALTMSPNPMMGTGQIRFRLSQASPVQAEVIDIVGRRVRNLAGGSLPAGEHLLRWDSRDDDGRIVSTGVYFVRVRANGLEETVRAVVLR